MEFIVGFIIGGGAVALVAYALAEKIAKFKRR